MTLNSARTRLILESYICRLTDAQTKFVEEEFYEFDNIRRKWIAEMRQWIIENPVMGWCRLDSLFLLRFLRYTKFARWCEAPVLAQEALVRYLAMRHIYPEWCRGLDPRGELMQKMIHDEVFTILGTDSIGRMIVWIQLGRFDADSLDSIVVLRYTVMFLELMAEHEPVHIGGIKVWVDYTGTTWKHFIRYNFDLLREFKKIVEKVIPVWIREVHNVALPQIASSYRTFLCTLDVDLFKYKTFWHATSAEAMKHFEKHNWPEECGGPCNATRQAGYLKRWFEEKRDFLLVLDRMDIDVGLNDIRFFKPYYEGPSRASTGGEIDEFVKKMPKFQAMAMVKTEIPDTETTKIHGKENVQPSNDKPSKKSAKNKKKQTVKSKVDSGIKGSGKSGKKDITEAKINKRASLPGEKSNAKKPWK